MEDFIDYKGTEKSLQNRTVSYFFQIIENHIIYIINRYLVDKKIIPPRTHELEYDGLCLPPYDYDDNILITEIENDLFNTTKKIKLTVTPKFIGLNLKSHRTKK